MCDRHLKKERRRKRLAARAARNNNRELGLCAYCPAKSETYMCPVCAVKRDQIPRACVAKNVADKQEQWRKDGDGWNRYRGKGRRGPPGNAVNDAEDLRDALRALERGTEALVYARSPEVQELPRIQRAGVRAEAVGFLAHAARFIDEVVDRNQPKGAE